MLTTADLREDYDKSCKVNGGTIYLKGATVQVWWDNNCPETWHLPNNEWGRQQSLENFNNMVERFS